VGFSKPEVREQGEVRSKEAFPVADVHGQQPEQQQPGPGTTAEMEPKPRDEMADYLGRGLLAGKRALITGGDSGIGRAVAVAFAKEGADVAIAYLSEHDDARHTANLVTAAGHRAVLLPGELADEQHATQIVEQTVAELGGLDILVNHVGTQTPAKSLEELSSEQWDYTFKVNIYSHFWTTKAALRHLPDGAAIINTASINGLRGNKTLLDYSATKGAIIAFTYSLAQNLVERRIRVNAVAPGPVWTPLIPATFPPEKTSSFGQQVPMGRAAHPDEIAPSYVFFAAEQLSSYYTGEVLAPIGGETLPG
jgi:NAD(P)-dependent dehydrogenase (short-subunit alcohol dehydrogenase family)